MLVKRGRPRKRDREAKNREIRVRLSEDDSDKLIDMSEETGLSRSEIIRRSIDLYYTKLRY